MKKSHIIFNLRNFFEYGIKIVTFIAQRGVRMKLFLSYYFTYALLKAQKKSVVYPCGYHHMLKCLQVKENHIFRHLLFYSSFSILQPYNGIFQHWIKPFHKCKEGNNAIAKGQITIMDILKIKIHINGMWFT